MFSNWFSRKRKLNTSFIFFIVWCISVVLIAYFSTLSTLIVVKTTLLLPVAYLAYMTSVSIISASKNKNLKNFNIVDISIDTKCAILLSVALGIFVELAIIRFYSTYFQLFSYLKNLTLISAFLGLGIGYALPKKIKPFVYLGFWLFLLQILFMESMTTSPFHLVLQNPLPDSFGMGTTNHVKDIGLVTTIYVLIGVLFTVSTLSFIPFGQLASYYMQKKKPLESYGLNLLGSLCGIIAFSAISFMQVDSFVWILLALVLVIPFIYKHQQLLFGTVLATAFVILLLNVPKDPSILRIFSPYQAIRVINSNEHDYTVISTNATYFQRMFDFDATGGSATKEEAENYYNVPYLLKPNLDRVLILGSGSGNDVAAALKQGAKHIDAVEIDPVIAQIGKKMHPNNPYRDPRVNLIITDARNFLETTTNEYDMIVFGLLDSHTLLSGKGGIRLDSYVYTQESLNKAKSLLNQEHGVISLSFAVLSSSIGGRIYAMVDNLYVDQAPIVLNTSYDDSYTFLAGPGITSELTTTSSSVYKTDFFKKVASKVDVSTDNWPFFYNSKKEIPVATLTFLILTVLVSFLLLVKIIPSVKTSYSVVAFLLGAGFMLIDTKAITEIARYYGTTWLTISIVSAFVLIMAYLANLTVMKAKKTDINKVYLALLISIVLSFLLPLHILNALGFTYGKYLVSLVLVLPLYFSGIAFSKEIEKTNEVSMFLASNLFGAIVGGVLEYAAVGFGYSFLYLLAFIIYLTAFAFKVKK
ncbi:MAG: spermidine synthase [Patescibacteria group bacterium]